MGRRHEKKTEMKREAKTSTTLDCFMAPKRINSEAIPYHEHSDCLENTSLAEEGTSVFQERDHEHLLLRRDRVVFKIQITAFVLR